jgi:basic amino acid/polyamine antiporter, APA family
MTTAPLRPRLGWFDATMIVMGGIVGSGIFINPYVVALHVHTPFLILGCWAMGGLLALLGAFVWAELATRLPGAGGQYLYLREAYHPSVAFLYGWVLLLVTQTGGMAAVAVTFARYFREISGSAASDAAIAATALLGLTAINCFGVRAGSNVQTLLMLLKAAAIVAMVVAGVWLGGGSLHPLPLLDRPASLSLAKAVGAAMIPIAFAYGGWQTSSFLAGEMRDPRRDLSRGLLFGVAGVIVLYLSVNFVCLRVLGPDALAATHTPASAVMRAALGDRGAWWIAVGIAVSTLGFLSQGILTAPRVYYAMARDGLFFQSVGKLSVRTGAPVVAIILQGIAATIIAVSGRYEQILNYVVSVDFISFALTAASLFVFRHRAPVTRSEAISAHKAPHEASQTAREEALYLTPGHPFTTALFVLACAAIVAVTVASYPGNSAFGFVILLAGIPVYLYWRRKTKTTRPPQPNET